MFANILECLLIARHRSINTNLLHPHNGPARSAIIIPILQVGKLKTDGFNNLLSDN